MYLFALLFSVLLAGGSACVSLAQGTWGCTWGCQAQDLSVTRVYLADASGVEFATCTTGSTISNAYIWATISTGTRYAAWAHFDLWVGGVPTAYVDTCFAGTLTSGHHRIYGPISWTCGDSITLINLEVNLPGSGGCPGDDPTCTQRKVKCAGPIPTFTVETPTPESDLALTKTANPNPAGVGQTATFTLSVTNNGPDAAANVVVTDPLPGGFSNPEASIDRGAWSPYGGSVNLGTMADGASSEVRIRATVDCLVGCNTSLANTATVATTTDDPSGGNNSSTIVLTVEDATLSASNDAATVLQGDTIQVDVVANDTHPCYLKSQLTLSIVSGPSHGQAQVVAGGIQYTAESDYAGADSLQYEITDPCGGSAQAKVDFTVLRHNQPPRANANGVYLGMVGDPILLDARFSTDPDIQDTLEYRWDIDNDGKWDTDWLTTATHEVVFDRPYRGLISVEVRDLYRGQPTGDSAQAKALARIEQRPPELRGVLFVDLNANGEYDADEPPLSQIPLLLDEEILASTDEEGRASFTDLEPGEHTATITGDGLALLRLQGLQVEKTSLALDVQPGDPTVAPFPARRVVGTLIGLVYVDRDGSGEQEVDEPGVPGLRVLLDDRTERTTNGEGRFLFMNVLAGDYVLLIEGERHRWEGSVRIVTGEEGELVVIWPAPDSGFLEVKIQLGEPDGEGGG